jgi:hypothetical protein
MGSTGPLFQNILHIIIKLRFSLCILYGTGYGTGQPGNPQNTVISNQAGRTDGFREARLLLPCP